MSNIATMLFRRDDDDDLYKYDPSKGTAIFFTVVFCLLTTLHTYQLVRTRTWYFIAFLCGGFAESIGYITRVASINEKPNYTTGLYVVSQLLVLIAPSLFAASMYMELGRIIRLVGGEAYAIIRVNWLTKIFVVGDVFAFFLQGAGGALLSSDKNSTSNTGKTVLKIGLIVQILFFALFVGTSGTFHYRIVRHPTPKTKNTTSPPLPWKKHLITVYAASIIVLGRCIFRLIEYSEGEEGYLLTHEWTMYAFDALLMVLVMVVFAVVHPSEVKGLLNGGGGVVRNVFRIEQLRVERRDWEGEFEELRG